ncbi:MAG: glycoside hydrolase family 26 protein [Proteobacteria bacterium]|nr:glycoside hydrolase family 26 protein [Pseudomonadota bacterium]
MIHHVRHISRPPFAGLLLLLLLLLLGSGCRDREMIEAAEQRTTQATGPVTLAMPDKGVYAGAYVDFGEGESQVSYDALTAFERLTGKSLAVVAFGNFWGDNAFPEKTVRIIEGYGAVPLLFWSPWDKPYNEARGPDKFGLREILAGKWDKYIDDWADAARQHGKPLLVSWGLEMNGTWFPWSGKFYGGGKVIGHKDGRTLYAGPELYKQVYRYVVDRVRARKATNILWNFQANNFGSPQTAWNRMSNYYPGSDYVDWLGLSVYGKMARSEGWAEFGAMMAEPYAEICKLDPEKPVMVAEWGVGEYPPGDKAGFITTALRDMPGKYPRVRLAVYWHERWENKDGSYSNLRVNSSPEALKAYREGIASPLWIGRPRFEPQTLGR